MAAHKNSRNKSLALAGGVSRFSRSVMYRKKALYKRKKTPAKPAEAAKAATKTKAINGGKNGATRVVALQKAPGFYPVVDVPHKLASHKVVGKTTLRSSITPGTVLVLLAGAHRGHRVVFLKQLPSGLLLVTGPFKINGVPVRRVNQAYVLATSQKLDISKVTIDEKFTDSYFKKAATKKGGKEGFLEKGAAKTEKVDAAHKEDQKKLDAQLLPLIKAVPNLGKYIGSLFTLDHGQFPHLMKF